MKIVHVVESFATGVFDFLVSQINGMGDFEHVIIHGIRSDTPQDYKRYFPERTEFYHWKSAKREINPLHDLTALFELIRILVDIKKYDVVHLHSSKAGLIGRVACRMLRNNKRVVYTPHGVSFLRTDITRYQKRIYIAFERIGSKFGGTIVGCSKSEALEFNNNGITATYIYNGIECEKWDSNKEVSPKNIITVSTMGRISEQKGPSLFNYIATEYDNLSNVRFIWIGDGELRSVLKSKNIVITGWLNKDEVKETLLNTDIYISTSKWEGLPLSVLQAMCLSKPLVLTTCVGNRDLLEEEINGYFIHGREAPKGLTELINNPQLRIKLGEKSREKVEMFFPLYKCIKNYRLLYMELGTRS